VWDWDLARGHMLYSKCWLHMHGYADGEIDATAAGCAALIHPDDAPAQRARLTAYLDGRAARYLSEHRERCKDGRWIWVLDHGMVMRRGPDGQPLRMICTQADITERKHAEQALKELNEQLESRVDARTAELRQVMQQVTESEKLASLGGLVAGVAHELNTPIGNMLLAASALEEKLGEIVQAIRQGSMTRSAILSVLAEGIDASQVIVRNGQRSSELIASFKRVAVDQTSQRRRRFDLRSTVQDIVRALGTVTRHAQVAVQVDIPDGIAMDSYPGHLEQIITNLVMNSVVHGCEGMSDGCIAIGARAGNGNVTLTYRDNGRGIAPEVQHKVFEPFYTTRMGQGGSGLGLTIVHNLVHGVLKGQIRLESEAGRGIRLEISVPLCTPG
jgi:PAS domain S-box-containing protein